MQVSKLEELSARLRRLRDRLAGTSLSRDAPLDDGSELVQAARECEFMLPERLTVGSLAETVERKIAIVGALLERARIHEALPEEVRMVADHEYMASEEDATADRTENAARGRQAPPRY